MVSLKRKGYSSCVIQVRLKRKSISCFTACYKMSSSGWSELCFREGTFLWWILFVELGTGDKGQLQCNVIWKLCLVFLVSYKSMRVPHLYVQDINTTNIILDSTFNLFYANLNPNKSS